MPETSCCRAAVSGDFHVKFDRNLSRKSGKVGTNSFLPVSGVMILTEEPILAKLTSVRRIFVSNSHSEFFEVMTDRLVDDAMLQTDGRTDEWKDVIST